MIITFETKIFEFVALRVCDVTGLLAEILRRQLQVGLPSRHGSSSVFRGYLFERTSPQGGEGIV
jgi:hypothetical protein